MTEPKFKKGDRVIAGDGICNDPATIISGPHQQLTSHLLVYIVQFDNEDDHWAGYEAEIFPLIEEVKNE